MIATTVIVAAFNNSTQLTNAYGFAVATVMFTTSVLISIQMRYVKHLPWTVGILFLLFFGFLDGNWVVITFAPMLTHFRSFLGRIIKEGSQRSMGATHVRHHSVRLHPSNREIVLIILSLTFMTFWTWAKVLYSSLLFRDPAELSIFRD